VYLSAPGTAAATTAGTASQFLKGGTTPSWSAIQAADIPNNAANTSGTAAGLSATLALTSGGTSQTSAQGAINTLAGAVTNASYLRGNGTNVVMSAIQAADIPNNAANTSGSSASCTGTAVYADSLNRTNDQRAGAAPNNIGGVTLKLYFTTWANNNTGNFADGIIMNTWVDGSGGWTNMLSLQKGAAGIRQYYGTFGSAANFNTYYDALMVSSAGQIQTYTSVGIGVSPATYNLQVSGTIGATGDITAFTSDERLKFKTGPITDALDKVCTLDTFTYTHNDLARSFGFTDKRHYVGISAQQVRKIQPEVVRIAPFDADGEGSKSGQEYITVQYERLVPLLIEALKEERKAREALGERIKLLEQK
jgi:hypothetical protein